MKKENLWMIAVAVFALITTIPAYAGTWKQDTIGWWYQNDDGSYLKNTWQWLDGNRDGLAESYCFDGNGYLITNIITPDGYQVDGDGAWVAEGVVQRKRAAVISGKTGAAVGGSESGQGTRGTTNENGSVVKRIGTHWSEKVDGGTTYGYYDYTGWTYFDEEKVIDDAIAKNYAVDGEIFCPDNIHFPDCILTEVQLNGDVVVKVTPIWIENGTWLYGGFGSYETYIRGRMEWREYEDSDPAYAEQLKTQLTEEAKQRAFEIYPDMIVDYTD